MIAQLSDGRFIKAERAATIDEREFKARLEYAERTGQAASYDADAEQIEHQLRARREAGG